MRRLDTTGGWSEYIPSVNEVIEDLTGHANEIARVVTAVATRRPRADDGCSRTAATARGAASSFATRRIVNGMVARLSQFGSEVTRVAQEVGGEGKLGAQARVQGVSGVWKDLTDSVNLMASNLTSQVREIARVTTAVAQGDLTKTITIDVKGEILELKNTINTMVEQLRAFANEVTRVAREVGTEGRLGGQATVRGVSGVWRELTESVNSMANNLTFQVRNIAEVTTRRRRAVTSARRSPSRRRARSSALKNTINTMVDQLSRVRRRGDARRARGRHRGRARRSGRGRRRLRRVARADPERQRHGVEPDVAGAQHRRGRHRDRRRRPVARRSASTRAARSSRSRTRSTRRSTSSNRFSAEVTRVARLVGTEGTLGVHRRRQGRVGHLEGADRQRQPDGEEPDQPGSRHRRGDDRGRERRPRRARSPSRRAASSSR